MRIGFVKAYYLGSDSESSVLLDIQLLDGTIAPELGNIPVTVSFDIATDSGGPQNAFCCHGHTQALYMFWPTSVNKLPYVSFLNSSGTPFSDGLHDVQFTFNFNSETQIYTTFAVPIPIDRTLELWGLSMLIIATTNTRRFPGVVLEPDEIEIDDIIGVLSYLTL